VRAALGPLPFDVAPVVAVTALGLAVAPVLWLGALKEVVPVTSTDMVERLVPTTTTYVELSGLAMTVPFPAPGSFHRPPYGLLVRDTLASSDLTVVSTGAGPRSLLERTVLARMVARPFVDEVAERFSSRGEDVGGLEPARILFEVEPDPDEPVVVVESVAELGTLPDGSLISMPLEFAGESIPSCVIESSCRRGDLAAAAGIFLHLARDADGSGTILVQTGYPSSVTPGVWAGDQVHWSEPFDVGLLETYEYDLDPALPPLTNRQALEEFAERPGVQALAGWGRILDQSSVTHDPELIRDRLWLGPILFATFGGLLLLGERLGYPHFRPDVGGSRRWTTGGSAPPAGPAVPADAGPLSVVVSGHALKPEGNRWHLDEAPAVLRPTGDRADGRVTAALHLADGTVIPLAAHDTGLLGRVERGSVIRLTGERPALWAHWYGTDLRMTFESEAARDAAADLVAGGGGPVRSEA
jgi:hypothetical protein